MVAIESQSDNKPDFLRVVHPVPGESRPSFTDSTTLEWGDGSEDRLNASPLTPFLYSMKLKNGVLTVEDMIAVGRLSELKEHLFSKGYVNPVSIMTEGPVSAGSDEMLRAIGKDTGLQIFTWEDVKEGGKNLEHLDSARIHWSASRFYSLEIIAQELFPNLNPYRAFKTLEAHNWVPGWVDNIKDKFVQGKTLEYAFNPIKVRMGDQPEDVAVDNVFFHETPKLILRPKTVIAQ